MGGFAHAQTVDTRPPSSPPTWPGYEANLTTDNPLDIHERVTTTTLRNVILWIKADSLTGVH